MSNNSKSQENSKKKVLMLAHVFPPFQSIGHSIRVIKFIKYLPDLGWLPVVLTIDDQTELSSYLKQGSDSLLSEISQDVKIYRTNSGEPSLDYLEKERIFGDQNFFFLSLVKFIKKARNWIFRNIFLPDWHIAWLPFALKKGRQIIKNENIDVIFATCPPHSASIIGACLKKLSGKPLVLDFRDDWIDTPWFNSRTAVIRKIERLLEKWVVKTADSVILVTEQSQKAFLDRYPNQPKTKFVFISNGVDLEDYSLLNFSTPIQNEKTFTITHAGSLNDSTSWVRSPAAFFQAVHNILKRRPEISKYFKIVFTGLLPETQKKLVNELGLSDVVNAVGFLQQQDLLSLFKASSLLLVINYEGFSTLIPGKIYEYWAVGGPPILLLSHEGAASILLEKYSLGRTVNQRDVEGIEEALLDIYEMKKTNNPLRINPNGSELFDRKVLTQKLATLFLAINTNV